MLKSYHRRTCLLALALSALDPSLAAAAGNAQAPVNPGSANRTGPSAPPSATGQATSAGAVAIASAAGPSGVSGARSTTPSAPAAGAAVPLATLWDALSDTDTVTSVAEQMASAPVRVPLGPVPGFTLPGARTAANTPLSDFYTKKRGRTGIFGPLGDWFDRIGEVTGTKVKVSGHETLSLRWDQISGGQQAQQAFQDEQYFGRGSNGLYNDADLTVDATVFKYLHYETRFSNSLYGNPYDNRAKLDYNTKALRVQAGDINAGFQGNSLIDFNRYLSGVQVTSQWAPHFRTSMLYSATKAAPHTITIPGNDSAGPYYVYAGQIVQGSEQVRVDNRPLVEGHDYTLDTFSGQLQFLNGMIVLHTSTIAVTYESYNYGTAGSTIMGLRQEYQPKGPFQLGFEYVRQSQPTRSGLHLLQQHFSGYGTPSATYTLDAPVDPTKLGLLQVTKDGVLLVRGVDYIWDQRYPNQIVIIPAMPVQANIIVQYFPYDANPTPGNASVMGLDGKLSLGKLGSVTMETAMSGLSLTGHDIGGRAWQIAAELDPSKRLHTRLAVKDVSPSFSGIQSPGFNLNEKSMQLGADYTATSRLKLNFNWEKSDRPSYTSALSLATPVISATGSDAYNQYTIGASYTLTKNASLSLTHASMGTNFAVGGNSNNASDTLSLNYGLRNVSLEAALSKVHSNSLFLSEATTATTTGGTTTPAQLIGSASDTFSKRIGVHWQPKSWLSLSSSLSDNTISNTGVGNFSHADARDAQVAANFSLIRNLKLDYSLDLSDTGNLSAYQTAAANGGSLVGGTTTGAPSTTGGTTSTGGSSILGTPMRSVFAAMFPAFNTTRDAGAGGTATGAAGTGTTGTATTGLGGFGAGPLLGGVYNPAFGGGGYNGNLGGYGNYSGIYGTNASALNGFAGSFGGRSLTNRIAASYTPKRNVQVGLQLDHSGSIGDYQYNSTRDNFGFNLNWQANSRMQLNASYTLSRVLYTAGYGGSDSDVLQFMFQGRPFGGKLGMQLSWQTLITKSKLNLAALSTGATAGTGTTSTPTDTSTDLTSIYLRLEYPLARRISLFTNLTIADATGYLGSTEQDMQLGLDFAITSIWKFSLGWQSINRMNAANSVAGSNENAYNYHANSLLAEVGLRF